MAAMDRAVNSNRRAASGLNEQLSLEHAPRELE